MVSSYEYITVANLENFANTDYSAVDATYTDTVIESNISQAERLINTYCNTSFSATLPDAVVYVTYHVALRLMHNRMIYDGSNVGMNNNKPFDPIFTDELKELLKPFIMMNSTIRTVWWS